MTGGVSYYLPSVSSTAYAMHLFLIPSPLIVSSSEVRDALLGEKSIQEIYAMTEHADMTKPLPFADESFDLVVNPVSLVFVREVEPIWREVARVLCPGGILVSGLDTGINYIVDDTESSIVHGLPFDPIAEPELATRLAEEDGGMQFSHTLEESLGGLLRAGFAIDDLYEDTNGEGRLHELGIPSYIAVRATRLRG